MPKEKSLAIDIWRLRQHVADRTLDIRHVVRRLNIADVITKGKSEKFTEELLHEVLKSGRYPHLV